MAIIRGCTDSTAANYNPLATHDNGRCVASRHRNITGELVQELFAPGDNMRTSKISLTNTDATADIEIQAYTGTNIIGYAYFSEGTPLIAS